MDRLRDIAVARQRGTPLRYAVAIVTIMVVGLIQAATFGSSAPWFLYTPAVLVLTLFLGRGPGVLATILSALGAGFVVSNADNPALLTPVHWGASVIFVLTTLAMVHLVEALRTALIETDRLRDEREKALVVTAGREAFLSSVLSSSTDCIKVLDLGGKLTFMSEGGQKVMEVSDFNAIDGCPWPDFWQEAGHLAAKEAIAAARAGRPATFQGFADTMKGNRRYWDVRVSPIFGPDGHPERILSVSRDITALKASEEARVVLVHEMAHRMKNTLAMVQAVVTQTLRQTTSMDEGRQAVARRLTALGRAQDILTRSDFTEADIGDVVSAAIAPHRIAEERITWDGPRMGLTAQQALGLSLAIHELATNAAKYGSLSNESGRVAMSWGAADGAFRFEWIETGGPKVVAPESRGFGSKLIERIVGAYFDGEGRIEFDPAGIQFILTGAPEAASASS